MAYTRVALFECNKCGETKPESGFCKEARNKRGVRYSCKACEKPGRDAYNNRTKEKRQAYYAERVDVQRERNLIATYGITAEQYQEKFHAQNGLCAICLEPENAKWLAVDHDHSCCRGKNSCGKCVRALLCSKCNQGIGLLQDDPNVLMAAAAYLLQNTNVLNGEKAWL